MSNSNSVSTEEEYTKIFEDLTPVTQDLIRTSALIPDNMQTPDIAGDFLLNTVAPKLQAAIEQDVCDQNTPDSIVIGQTAIAVLAIAMSVGSSLRRLNIRKALEALTGK